jgi:hypothetical protein
LSEESALQKRTASTELRSLQDAAVQATRRVEIDVLQVVTPTEIADLGRLRLARDKAQDALDALVGSVHVIDLDYIERRKALGAVVDAAHSAYAARWQELFE